MTVADELIAILGYELTGEEKARQFGKTIDGLNKKLTAFAVAAGRVAAGAAVAATTGFGLLGRAVLQTSAEFESYQTTLETIEGSAEAAAASMEWIAEFGKTTPYNVAQVTAAFVKLKAYGIDPLTDDALRALGDTASAMGKPLNQAVEAFADAATGEFERLKEFGIKAKTEGDNVTFSWTENGEELTRTVKKNSTEIRAFLLETLGGRFAGAMDRQSRTWNGMMSNLGDTWTDFKRRIGDTGFFDLISSKLKDFLETLKRLDKEGKIDEWAEQLSGSLSTALNVIDFLITRTVENISYLIENFEYLKGPLIAIGALFGLLAAAAFPVVTVFLALGLVIDDFLAYMQGAESFIGDFIKGIQNLTGASEDVAQIIAGLGVAIVLGIGAALILLPGIILSSMAGMVAVLAVIAAALLIKMAAKFETELQQLGADIQKWINSWSITVDPAAWFDAGVNAALALWEGLKSIGDDITAWFVGLLPDWAKNFIGGGSGSITSGTAPPITSGGVSQTDQPLPVGQSGSTALTDEAFDRKLELQRQEWMKMTGNLSENLARMMPDQAVAATVTDARQDNRQAPINSNVTVNQTVNQASDAPRAAARATGDAVASQVAQQRTQLEQGPSF